MSEKPEGTARPSKEDTSPIGARAGTKEVSETIRRLVWNWIRTRPYGCAPPAGVTWDELAAWCQEVFQTRFEKGDEGVLEAEVVNQAMNWAYDAAPVVLGLSRAKKPGVVASVTVSQKFKEIIKVCKDICTRLAGGSARADAEDIATKAVEKIIARIQSGGYLVESSLVTWLYTIVVRVAWRELKRERRRWKREVPEADLTGVGNDEGAPQTLEDVEQPEYPSGSPRQELDSFKCLLPGFCELVEYAQQWGQERHGSPQYGKDHLLLCLDEIQRKEVAERWRRDTSTIHRHQQDFRQYLGFHLSFGKTSGSYTSGQPDERPPSGKGNTEEDKVSRGGNLSERSGRSGG